MRASDRNTDRTADATGLRRRSFTHLGAAALASLALPQRADAAGIGPGDNILRIAFLAAETGMDPAKVGDLYSSIVNAHIFESPCGYDPLAFPVKPKPKTAAALPEVSEDFRVWTVRIRPGIHFCDDPAFQGRKRELVAADYVYSYKRFFDPANNSPFFSNFADERILGLGELRQRALSTKQPFDYDSEIEGLRVLDRYTFQIRLAEPRPRFISLLCNSATCGAVAREVIEHYAGDTMAHPVGTGPYRLAEYRRSSRMLLLRNPNFRDEFYDGEPAPDDAQGQAWLAKFKGRKLPLNDGAEVVVIEEGQPRWLSFLNGQTDFVRVPPEYTFHAAPAGTLAPNLAKRGITARRYVNPDFTMSWFNMEDPVVGGYTPEKVALRRAINLAYDIDREIRIVRRGQAIRAQAPMPPGTYGYDPNYRSTNSEFDPARAKALLDTYGYLDRDGDGWREMPDGSPLELNMATQQSALERQFDETWSKSLADVGIRVRFRTAQWPENMKAARAGKLQMWSLGSTATSPDAQGTLDYMYSPSIGSSNLARVKLPGFDEIVRRMNVLPDGPERAALFLEAAKIVTAYMPYRIHAHRVYTDVVHPWITGWRQPLFRNEVWQYVEIDTAMRTKLTA